MKMNAYSIYDTKGEAYSPPIFLHNDELAKRFFADLAADKSTTVGRHFVDFVLYRLGIFDDHTGELIPCTPVSLGHASKQNFPILEDEVPYIPTDLDKKIKEVVS